MSAILTMITYRHHLDSTWLAYRRGLGFCYCRIWIFSVCLGWGAKA